MAKSRNCNYCGGRFSTDVLRRVFCSDKCKVRYHRENRLTCFFCGEIATGLEHIVPQVYMDGAGDTVPACQECNSTMCHLAPESVEQRIQHLYRTYVRKYQLDKRIPEWDDAEMAELGPTLRSAISYKMNIRQRALERCVFIRARFKFIRS